MIVDDSFDVTVDGTVVVAIDVVDDFAGCGQRNWICARGLFLRRGHGKEYTNAGCETKVFGWPMRRQ